MVISALIRNNTTSAIHTTKVRSMAVDPKARGLGIGARHITVSTVGVLPGIVAMMSSPSR